MALLMPRASSPKPSVSLRKTAIARMGSALIPSFARRKKEISSPELSQRRPGGVVTQKEKRHALWKLTRELGEKRAQAIATHLDDAKLNKGEIVPRKFDEAMHDLEQDRPSILRDQDIDAARKTFDKEF